MANTFSNIEKSKIWQLHIEGDKQKVENLFNYLESKHNKNFNFFLFKQDYYYKAGNFNEMIVAFERAIELEPERVSLKLLLRFEQAYIKTHQLNSLKKLKKTLVNESYNIVGNIWNNCFLKNKKLTILQKKFIDNVDKDSIEKYFYCSSNINHIVRTKKIKPLFPYLEINDISNFIRRDESRLQRALTFQDKLISNGFAEVLCPYSNKLIKSKESYFVQYKSTFTFYLFRSTKPFFLVIGDVWQEIIGYYFPIENIQVHITKNRHQIEKVISKLKALIVYNLDSIKSKNLNKNKTCVIVRSNHFAHHLWNSASALERIIKRNLHKNIDKIFVLAQPLGSIKKIFNELKDKVQIIPKEEAHLLEEKLIRSSYNILPFGDAFIPQTLIDRLKLYYDNTTVKSVNDEIISFKKNHDFILWISFRSGSKTWDKQVEGYFEVIKSIKKNKPNLGVIIDGYTLPFFDTINNNTQKILDKEKELIDDLANALNGEKIACKILLGKRIDEVIKWGGIVHYYIAHQGSIQHKIAWFHNCPGYIHSNIKNLQIPQNQRPGVWEREGITKPKFAKPSFIKDIVKFDGKAKSGSVLSNYSINIDKVKKAINIHFDKIDNISMAKKNVPRWGNTSILAPKVFSKIMYYEILENVHHFFDKDYYYFEIGTNRGNSMQFAKGHAVGVDPNFLVEQRDIIGKKESLCLYQTTSNNFFEKYANSIYSERKIDFAFIDGLHHSDQVLLDFLNTEKYSSNKSLLFFHDVLPRTFETALKERQTGMWTGDVWKAIWVLYKNRKDLDFIFIDAPPSGLLLVQCKSKQHNCSLATQVKLMNEVKEVKDNTIYEYLDAIDVVSAKDFVSYISDFAAIPKFNDIKSRKLTLKSKPANSNI